MAELENPSEPNEHVGEVSPYASSKESATPSAGDTPTTPPNCHTDSILLTQNQKKLNYIDFHQYNILSLFANIGIAEAYLHELGFNIVLANELKKS